MSSSSKRSNQAVVLENQGRDLTQNFAFFSRFFKEVVLEKVGNFLVYSVFKQVCNKIVGFIKVLIKKKEK